MHPDDVHVAMVRMCRTKILEMILEMTLKDDRGSLLRARCLRCAGPRGPWGTWSVPGEEALGPFCHRL